jgi:glycosyltransferase involved in cell wall biosynthesis
MTHIDSNKLHPQQSSTLPLVSILIPAYNAELLIADTLRSATSQTWPRTEIIVVDDGSKDRTTAVAQQFESQGVRVVTQPNQGAAAARNNAFSQSSGDYIQWLDADDLLAPDKIARQMALVQQGLSTSFLLSSPWARFMHRPHRAQFTSSPLWCDLSPVDWLLRKMGQNTFMQTATWLVSRSLTTAAGPWDTRLLGDDDGEYFCRVLRASAGVRFVPDANVYYRVQPKSLSYIGRSQRKIDAHWLSMKLHVQYLRSLEDSPRTRAACIQFLRNSLVFFYPDQEFILSEAEQLADELGDTLGIPLLPKKYALIQRIAGWRAARSLQIQVQNFRRKFEMKVDEIRSRAESQQRRGEMLL